jgi:hypothetical protein
MLLTGNAERTPDPAADSGWEMRASRADADDVAAAMFCVSQLRADRVVKILANAITARGSSKNQWTGKQVSPEGR